jgi:uncharacterized membrane protein
VRCHALAWTVEAIALFLLTQRRPAEAARMSLPRVAGWLLVGWGAFNIVEGLLNHHVLTLHHVRDDGVDPLPWDLGFLGISALLVLAGVGLIRPGIRMSPTEKQQRDAAALIKI